MKFIVSTHIQKITQNNIAIKNSFYKNIKATATVSLVAKTIIKQQKLLFVE